MISNGPRAYDYAYRNNTFIAHSNGQPDGSPTRRGKSEKTTRVRTVLNEKQLHTLRTCYAANPRPDAMMKEQLVEMTGLSPRVIRVWFQNKRCKDKKKSMMLNKTSSHHQHQGPGSDDGQVMSSFWNFVLAVCNERALERFLSMYSNANTQFCQRKDGNENTIYVQVVNRARKANVRHFLLCFVITKKRFAPWFRILFILFADRGCFLLT